MTTGKPLRLGVIGCGFFAQNHLNAWKEIEGVDLVAVCDVDPIKAQQAAYTFGAPQFYTDAQDMLAHETLDFVDIVTTPPSHRPIVELAAQHRVGVICQKPIAWTLEDARAMVEACQQAQVPFMVHENFRWQTPMRALRQLIDAGELGQPFFGRISFRTGHDLFAAQPWLRETPRFIVIEVAIHLLDLARFFFGEPRTVFCQTVRVNPAIKGEDVATIVLGLEGATCLVDCSSATPTEPEIFPETLVTIEGSHGTAHLTAGYQVQLMHQGSLDVQTLAIPAHSWAVPPWHVVQDSVFNTQRHWVECLRQGRTPETSGEDNLRVLELVFAAYESAEKNSAVNLR
jgi:predicted dehydrogenase